MSMSMSRKSTQEPEEPEKRPALGAGRGGLLHDCRQPPSRYGGIRPYHAPAVGWHPQADIAQEPVASAIAEAHRLIQSHASGLRLPGGEFTFLLPIIHEASGNNLPKACAGGIAESGDGEIAVVAHGRHVGHAEQR